MSNVWVNIVMINYINILNRPVNVFIPVIKESFYAGIICSGIFGLPGEFINDM